jgi:hypothetical protein
MVGSWKHIGNPAEKINIPGVKEGSIELSDKQFRSTSMKAGRVRTTMEEECREILHSVEEALAQEMQHEMRGAPGRTPPDRARIAACLHLQRAILRSVMLPRERATRKAPLRPRVLSGSPRAEKLALR